MIIRNEYGLPDPVYNALSGDYYTPGKNDFSITELYSPPQLVELNKRHQEEIAIDAIDNHYSVYGSAMHTLMEKYAEKDALTEKRFYVDIGLNDNNYRIGGQIDYYYQNVLRDYKVTSVWSAMYGSHYEAWNRQLAAYATLLKMHNYPVKHVEVCMFFRDWSRSKIRMTRNYPNQPIMLKAFKIPANEVTIRSISTALQHHVKAQSLTDAELAEQVPCTDADMWRKPSAFAIKRRGAKRALKVFDNKEDMWKYAKERHLMETDEKYIRLLRTHVWEKRPGECTRCEHYCTAKDFCHQYQQILNQQNETRTEQDEAKETKE